MTELPAGVNADPLLVPGSVLRMIRWIVRAQPLLLALRLIMGQ